LDNDKAKNSARKVDQDEMSESLAGGLLLWWLL